MKRNVLLITPLVVYPSAKDSKDLVLKENKGKSGIYRWVNLTTGDSYIGSASDLSVRLKKYYSINYLTNELSRGERRINRALLKHTIANFKLEILEYCAPKDIIKREQHYLDSLNPEYNILKIAGSSLGYKHSEETKAKIKSYVYTEKVLKKMSAAGIGRTIPDKVKIKIGIALGMVVIITDVESKSSIEYYSIRAAARALNTNMTTVRNYIKSGKLYQDKYKIEKKATLGETPA